MHLQFCVHQYMLRTIWVNALRYTVGGVVWGARQKTLPENVLKIPLILYIKISQIELLYHIAAIEPSVCNKVFVWKISYISVTYLGFLKEYKLK